MIKETKLIEEIAELEKNINIALWTCRRLRNDINTKEIDTRISEIEWFMLQVTLFKKKVLGDIK